MCINIEDDNDFTPKSSYDIIICKDKFNTSAVGCINGNQLLLDLPMTINIDGQCYYFINYYCNKYIVQRTQQNIITHSK